MGQAAGSRREQGGVSRGGPKQAGPRHVCPRSALAAYHSGVTEKNTSLPALTHCVHITTAVQLEKVGRSRSPSSSTPAARMDSGAAGRGPGRHDAKQAASWSPQAPSAGGRPSAQLIRRPVIVQEAQASPGISQRARMQRARQWWRSRPRRLLSMPPPAGPPGSGTRLSMRHAGEHAGRQARMCAPYLFCAFLNLSPLSSAPAGRQPRGRGGVSAPQQLLRAGTAAAAAAAARTQARRRGLLRPKRLQQGALGLPTAWHAPAQEYSMTSISSLGRGSDEVLAGLYAGS